MLTKRYSKAICILLPLLLLAVWLLPESEPPGNGTVRLNVAEWVPAFEHAGQWSVVPVDGTAEDRVESTDPNTTIELPAGRYDVYWVQSYEHEQGPMLLAGGVLVEPAQETTVDADSGIHLDQSDWVPSFGHQGWWGAVLAGKASSFRVNWTDDDLDLLLPPGRYDVYWVQDYRHASNPMRLTCCVVVESGAATIVGALGGIRLDQADWVPGFGHQGWWGAVPVGKPLSDRVDWTDSGQYLLLPPGRYDVYWVKDYLHEKDPMRLGRDVLVEPGLETTFDAHSGIRLVMAETVPEIGHDGWWGAVPVDRTMAERIDWSPEKSAPLLLPPGTYDVYWKQDYNSEATRILESVVVQPGQLSEVAAEVSFAPGG